MDPNATLRDIEDCLETALAARTQMDRREHSAAMAAAREARANLREWLAAGGFEPAWDAYPVATAYVNR